MVSKDERSLPHFYRLRLLSMSCKNEFALVMTVHSHACAPPQDRYPVLFSAPGVSVCSVLPHPDPAHSSPSQYKRQKTLSQSQSTGQYWTLTKVNIEQLCSNLLLCTRSFPVSWESSESNTNLKPIGAVILLCVYYTLLLPRSRNLLDDIFQAYYFILNSYAKSKNVISHQR